MQIAGHMRGRALQEWDLLDESDKATFAVATQSLHSRLDPGSRALAAQDFRHTIQGEAHPVADFIRRLERTFQVAYERDSMSTESRDTLLHGQLQESLKCDVMRAPSVSGAQGYKELCLAAKNEKRLAELKKRQKYLRPMTLVSKHPSSGKPVLHKPEIQPSLKPQKTGTEPRRCYLCNKTGHLARHSRARTESGGRTGERRGKHVNAKQVRTAQEGGQRTSQRPHHQREDPLPTHEGGQRSSQRTHHQRKDPLPTHEGGQRSSQRTHHQRKDPLPFLYSSESEDGEDVRRVRVNDKGSCPQLAGVEIQGVPAQGIIDSGADISIMGELFKRVAAVARLKRRDFKRADKLYT